jgi:hypothetical protein
VVAVSAAEILGIIIGTAVTIVLKWAADRWPGPPKK